MTFDYSRAESLKGSPGSHVLKATALAFSSFVYHLLSDYRYNYAASSSSQNELEAKAKDGANANTCGGSRVYVQRK